jgi:hypothetical protein
MSRTDIDPGLTIQLRVGWNSLNRIPESHVSHTYVSDLVHCVFSTKLRQNLISSEIQPELWAFVGGSRVQMDSRR